MVLLGIRKSNGDPWLPDLWCIREGVCGDWHLSLAVQEDLGTKGPRWYNDENEPEEGGRIQVSRQILLGVELNSKWIVPGETVWARQCLTSLYLSAAWPFWAPHISNTLTAFQPILINLIATLIEDGDLKKKKNKKETCPIDFMSRLPFFTN